MITSACASSATGVYYRVRLLHGDDVTYFTGLMGLLTLPEMASGFLAACLPLSPQFFQGVKQLPFFSCMGPTLWSMLHLSSLDSSRVFMEKPEEECMSAWRGSRNTRMQSTRHFGWAEDREPGLVPENGLSETNEDTRIVQTVRISIANESEHMEESYD